MRKKYTWYLVPDESETDQAWTKGTLTVDANVLLDLYRYHEQTRENLLKAIEAWTGRVWLSNQAAEEFFRNRKAVITSAEKTFKDAKATIEDIEKAIVGLIGALTGHRLVPRPIIDELNKSVRAAISDAAKQIEASKEGHPNYLKADPILDRIMTLFDGRVGDPFEEKDRKGRLEEGERRKLAKIPPGYMDDDKDGERPYGDFLLWQQTLDFAKSSGSPVVLVTSERKEDWWEKHGGRRVGPRHELLREAWEYSGQRFWIYQTDHFLEISSTRGGSDVDKASMEEIREVSAQRVAKRPYATPAVDVQQTVFQADASRSHGQLTIRLLRPIPALTGSGHFDPNMEQPPKVRLTLVSHPAGIPEIRLRGSTGTVFDFNVHIGSSIFGQMLPVGDYVVEYEATCSLDTTIASQVVGALEELGEARRDVDSQTSR
jgi:hypothetical protein